MGDNSERNKVRLELRFRTILTACWLLVASLHALIKARWTTIAYMSRNEYRMAVGYLNGFVHLVGGNEGDYDTVMIYDVKRNNFTTIDAITNSYLHPSRWLWSGSQAWIQIGNILYIADYAYWNDLPNHHYLTAYDLSTQTIDYQSVSLPFITDYEDGIWHGCLAGTEHFIFFIGGSTYVNSSLTSSKSLYILHISNASWVPGPNMIQPRSYMPCIVSKDELYSIGGADEEVYEPLDTVEFIHIDNIHANSWSNTKNTLSEPIDSTRAVVFKTYIFIIGGLIKGWEDRYYSTAKVHISDTFSNIIYQSADNLQIGVADTASIVINDSIYSFGGLYQYYDDVDERSFVRAVQYYIIPTTQDPTQDPARDPTRDPTFDPTEDPTSNPTINPSGATANPTSAPTENPTSEPTEDPTRDPTFDPTEDPRFNPSEPTADPTPYLRQSMNHRENQPYLSIREMLRIALLLICGLTILLFIAYRCKQQKKIIETTTFIYNPLIIAIAIGEYDRNPTESQIPGHKFRNLESIDQDIKNLVNLFEFYLNYTMTPKYDISHEINTYWTKHELLRLFR